MIDGEEYGGEQPSTCWKLEPRNDTQCQPRVRLRWGCLSSELYKKLTRSRNSFCCNDKHFFLSLATNTGRNCAISMSGQTGLDNCCIEATKTSLPDSRIPSLRFSAHNSSFLLLYRRPTPLLTITKYLAGDSLMIALIVA
jgi:hypothetical protein